MWEYSGQKPFDIDVPLHPIGQTVDEGSIQGRLPGGHQAQVPLRQGQFLLPPQTPENRG